MPQWSDFRVPAGEGALAAAEGRRVTVLTRVDRGLQKLLEAEGAEGALRRSTSTTVGGKKGNKPSKMVKGSKISTAGPTGATTDETQHVTFAPQPALFSSQRSGGPIDRFASQRSSLEEKDERKAKREARHVEDQVEGREHNHKGKGTARDDPDYKPSRDELGLADGDWELINAGADAALEVQSDNEHVDGVAFCIAYILALVERYAPEELDNSPDQIYREGKIRSHIERLYLIAPFWERFVLGARRLYRWEEPRRTAAAAMIYFVLWYTDLIPTAFLL